jgi:nicotinamidase-related amidase
MDRIDPESSLLLVVDVQERLATAMPGEPLARLVANAGLLLEAARLLRVPVVASEQYPKGLGPTVTALADRLRAIGVQPIDKLAFGAADEPRIAQAIAAHSPRTVVIVGMETHVCVFQTARELVRRGYAVQVVADAVASRREEHRVLGLSLCERAGAIAVPAETVVFDWLRVAGTDEFRALSRLLR